MADQGLLCWNCGKPTGIMGRVTRMDSCVECMADLRCCYGCRHYNPSSHMQCRESIRTPVKDKDKNNFCDFFQKRDVTKKPGGISTSSGSKDDLKKRFDSLFED